MTTEPAAMTDADELRQQLLEHAGKACDNFEPQPDIHSHYCRHCCLSLGRHLARRAAAVLDTTSMSVHPAVAAWRAFRHGHRSVFDGSAEGRFLENRLERAFHEGWNAAERAVKTALRAW